MIFYEPHRRDKSILSHDPFKALIAPRPIGWVSTIGNAGAINLAPYSFFNAVADTPPMLAFSSNGKKDSQTFAEQSGEFVWNMPTWDLREKMNITSASFPASTSAPATSSATRFRAFTDGSPAAIRMAKSRVLRRLKQEFGDLVQ